MSGRGCPGLHCPGCGDGGSGWIIALVALAVAGAVLHAIWHTLVEAAEIAAVTILSAAAVAVIAGIGVLVHRARSDRPGRPITARPVYRLPPESRPGLSETSKPPIEPTRVLTPGQVAAIVTQRSIYHEE